MTLPAPDRRREIRESLLAWYRRDRRRLPWREEPTPWRVLVSELMLQQTRVETVVPYFERFLRRFPDAPSLSNARQEDVLSAWAGLGYYRRARSLRAAARRIVEDHGGSVPGNAMLLRELPGVGEYTAAAVGSIAFDLPLAVLDGNVERVVARLFALTGRRGDGKLRRRVREIVDALLDPDAPGDFNQAVMELGARVCTPRSPTCLVCPVREPCDSRRRGDPEMRPAPPVRREPEHVTRRAALVRRAGRVLLVRRPDGGRMAGLYELPAADGNGDLATLRRRLADLGLEAEVGERLATVRHSVRHRRIVQHVHETMLRRPRRRRASDPWRFFRPGELAAAPLTGATAKSLAAAGVRIHGGEKRP
jgi:A/G-specific adenine glycosylase